MNNAITLTPAALVHMRASMSESPKGTLGIRFGLRDAGCSGYAYTIDFTDEQKVQDQVFEFDGVKIFVDQDNLKSLAGTEIDYVNHGINAMLSFNNPNVVDACGCGESFKFKDK